MFRLTQFTSTISFVVICFALSSHAEVRRFGLTSYKPTGYGDLEWAIEGGSNLKNSSTSNEESPSWDQTKSRTESDSRGVQFATWLGYFYQDSTFWLQISSGVGGSYAYSSDTSSGTSVFEDSFGNGDVKMQSRNETRRVTNRNIQTQLSASAARFLVGNLFLTGGGSLTYRYGDSPGLERQGRSRTQSSADPLYLDYRYSQSKEGYSGRSWEFSGSLTPGLGRVFSGSYAYTALMIIEVLRNERLLEREPTYKELQEFTSLIFAKRNTSAPDQRFHNIRSLVEIMEFLAANGITDPLGSIGYALVQDVWNYYPSTSGIVTLSQGIDDFYLGGRYYDFPVANSQRRFGWHIVVGLGWWYSHSHSDSYREGINEVYHRFTDDADSVVVEESRTSSFSQQNTFDNNMRSSLDAYVGYYKPLGLRWQLDAEAIATQIIDPLSCQHIESYWNPERPFAYSLDDIELESAKNLRCRLKLSYLFDARTTGALSVSYYEAESQLEITRFRKQHGTLLRLYPNTTSRSAFDQFVLSSQFEYRISLPTTLVFRGIYRIADEDALTPGNAEDFLITAEFTHFLY